MFTFQNITAYQKKLQEGETSCLEAVSYYLSRIEECKTLNAFLEVFTDEALKRAEELDRARSNGDPMGPLHGVVVSIKDVICYKDHRVSAASGILEGFVSPYSSTVVERLLNAGAIIIGRTNCDEFAMGSTSENSAFGPVKNGRDDKRVPGGSSGGAAVSLQQDMCMAAFGTDTGGSVRQPAAWCGIIGLKPTYGRISRYGIVAYASSFDQVGIFAHNMEDMALVLKTVAGSCSHDATSAKIPVPDYPGSLKNNTDNTPLKFAYYRQMIDNPALDPEIKSSMEQFFDKLTHKGYEVHCIDFDLLDYIVPAYYILTTAEASSNLARYDGVRYGYRHQGETEQDIQELYRKTRSDGFGTEVKRRIMLGTFVLSAGYYDAYFTKAQRVRRMLVDKTRMVFSKYDFILAPTVTTTALKIGEKIADPLALYMGDIYTVYANLVGIPGVSLPLFEQASSGLPFGLQLLAPAFEEGRLINASERLLKLKD